MSSLRNLQKLTEYHINLSLCRVIHKHASNQLSNFLQIKSLNVGHKEL